MSRRSISEKGFTRPAPRYFPFPGHRTMREVMDQELEDQRRGQAINDYYANLKAAG